MELFYQVLTQHPKRNRREWSACLTEDQIRTLLAEHRIKRDDQVRYADEETIQGSVAELLEGVAVPQPDLDLQEFDDYLDYEVETDVQLPPASQPKPPRSATERVKDGFRNVKRHRQQQRAKTGSSQRSPRLIPLTQCVAYVSFFISAMAALTSYGAYSKANATRGMDAMAAELRAEAALSICVSSACAGILVLGWAFLLQMVWEIHQSTVGD